MAYDNATAERVRRSLLAHHDLAERKMMGALCFMVDGHMCCGVMGSALMVRVGRDAYERTLTEPHVRPLEIGHRPATGFGLVERKSVVWGKSVSVRVYFGGRRIIKKKIDIYTIK